MWYYDKNYLMTAKSSFGPLTYSYHKSLKITDRKTNCFFYINF